MDQATEGRPHSHSQGPVNTVYLDAVRLLIAVAPAVFRRPVFALKGGTAINLFLRGMPRLSVDLDLVFVDHLAGRDEALHAIATELEAIRAEIEDFGLSCESGAIAEGGDVKLFVQKHRTRIKLEVNHVFRGTLLPVGSIPLTEPARNVFLSELTVPLLHPDEILGSKLVAAMDRQHPRDLFDVLGLREDVGLTPGIVECFVCYLAGHNRPVHEVLFARPIDIAPAFANEFAGMTRDDVPLDSLLETRRWLMDALPASLTDHQRRFLAGLVRGEADWSLMRFPHLKNLPAIRWKMENLARLSRTNPAKFRQQADETERRLQG